MSKATIMRYNQALVMLDTDPDIVSMICVRPDEDIYQVIDDTTHKYEGTMVDMCKAGRIRLVMPIDGPEGNYDHISISRDSISVDALGRVTIEGRCLFFQPVNKDSVKW